VVILTWPGGFLTLFFWCILSGFFLNWSVSQYDPDEKTSAEGVLLGGRMRYNRRYIDSLVGLLLKKYRQHHGRGRHNALI